MTGMASEVCGRVDETISMYTDMARRTVITKETRSPWFVGRRKERKASMEMTVHGKIKFKV